MTCSTSGLYFFDPEAEIPCEKGFVALLNAGMHDESRFGERAEHVGEDLLDFIYVMDFVTSKPSPKPLSRNFAISTPQMPTSKTRSTKSTR